MHFKTNYYTVQYATLHNHNQYTLSQSGDRCPGPTNEEVVYNRTPRGGGPPSTTPMAPLRQKVDPPRPPGSGDVPRLRDY